MQDWPALSYNQGTMSFDQYRQDPDGFRQHYQQPKKPNYTGWIIGCCVVPTVIGIGIAIWGAVWTARTLSGQNSFMSSMLPRAGVTTGTQLAWQEPLGRSHMLSPHMVCGDFDGDGAEEILLPGLSDMNPGQIMQQMQNPNAMHYMYNNVTVQADGSVSRQGTNSPVYFYDTTVWDYGNDGKDDIVDLWNSTGNAEVYDGKLNPLTSLSGGSMGFGTSTADVDGDGVLELVLTDANQTQQMVYDSAGTLLHTLQNGNSYNPVWGDIDGDGKDEQLICVMGGTNDLLVRHPDKQDVTIANVWPDYAWPTLTQDVDGDGRDEVFASHTGYYNPATASFTKFSYPLSYSADDPSRMVYPVDIDGDGIVEFATGGSNYSMDSALFIFDAAGNCTYHEEFGATVESKAVITDGKGRQHLVVLCDNRLLLYP